MDAFRPLSEKVFGMQTTPGVITDDDLALINAKYALRPLTTEKVYALKIRLASDQVDRDGEQFNRAYLERFAVTLPGKSLMDAHMHYTRPLGRFYGATVTDDASGSVWLDTAAYIVKTPGNEELRDQIDGGVLCWASIGFYPDQITCSICGMAVYDFDVCPHIPGQTYGPVRCVARYEGDESKVEAVEGSLCYLGAQYGAAVTKGTRSPISAKAPAASRYEEDLDTALAAVAGVLERGKSIDDSRRQDGRTLGAARLTQLDRLQAGLQDLTTRARSATEDASAKDAASQEDPSPTVGSLLDTSAGASPSGDPPKVALVDSAEVLALELSLLNRKLARHLGDPRLGLPEAAPRTH